MVDLWLVHQYLSVFHLIMQYVVSWANLLQVVSLWWNSVYLHVQSTLDMTCVTPSQLFKTITTIYLITNIKHWWLKQMYRAQVVKLCGGFQGHLSTELSQCNDYHSQSSNMGVSQCGTSVYVSQCGKITLRNKAQPSCWWLECYVAIEINAQLVGRIL